MKRDAVIQFIRACVAHLTGRPELEHVLDEQGQLQEYGIDSVALINLVVMIEQKFAIFYEDEELIEENFSSLHIVAERLLEKLGAKI
ncbi:MAG: hypothetical protein K0R57_606 [Paenibacillaceae bacterium]|jgi:acyl carrier protein|nr:hypothetical protein [Paenibacillaceae bacterium]